MTNLMGKLTSLDIKSTLAVYWSVVASGLLFYILKYHGDKIEILTFILGMLGSNIIGGIFGVYFGGTHNKKPDGSITTDSTSETTTTTSTKIEPQQENPTI